MEDKLVEFLLGDLDPDESAQVERCMQSSPELAARLAALRAMFGLLAADCDDEPPEGLATRTCQMVRGLVAKPQAV